MYPEYTSADGTRQKIPRDEKYQYAYSTLDKWKTTIHWFLLCMMILYGTGFTVSMILSNGDTRQGRLWGNATIVIDGVVTRSWRWDVGTIMFNIFFALNFLVYCIMYVSYLCKLHRKDATLEGGANFVGHYLVSLEKSGYDVLYIASIFPLSALFVVLLEIVHITDSLKQTSLAMNLIMTAIQFVFAESAEWRKRRSLNGTTASGQLTGGALIWITAAILKAGVYAIVLYTYFAAAQSHPDETTGVLFMFFSVDMLITAVSAFSVFGNPFGICMKSVPLTTDQEQYFNFNLWVSVIRQILVLMMGTILVGIVWGQGLLKNRDDVSF